MHDVQHNDSAPYVPRGAVQRRAAPRGAVRRAAPCSADGAQTGAALLRRTTGSVNAP